MPLDMSQLAGFLQPEDVQASLEGEYPNSRVLMTHSLPDVIDNHGVRHELRLVSSIPQPYPLTAPLWDGEAVAEVNRRLGRDIGEDGNLTGARKGRVLYLLLGGITGAAPVAFLTFHVRPAGDIELLGADSILSDGGYHHVEVLLTAARRVALLFGTDRDHLFWSCDLAYFDQIARRHGFDDVPSRIEGPDAAGFQLEAMF